ncbi:hypothetical protein B0T14DRAFT_11193 [Immersiella caudata]|uniref:Uncharacterized protein n=1 Tax=Immersiella caudata TaxID=314043 RepID=A0AA40CB60_9PEZI|nr:hypothetical protein B0T14DRAFT_11193 [Immersiella caudata]
MVNRGRNQERHLPTHVFQSIGSRWRLKSGLPTSLEDSPPHESLSNTLVEKRGRIGRCSTPPGTDAPSTTTRHFVSRWPTTVRNNRDLGGVPTCPPTQKLLTINLAGKVNLIYRSWKTSGNMFPSTDFGPPSTFFAPNRGPATPGPLRACQLSPVSVLRVNPGALWKRNSRLPKRSHGGGARSFCLLPRSLVAPTSKRMHGWTSELRGSLLGEAWCESTSLPCTSPAMQSIMCRERDGWPGG